ncbi:hypothetical protein BDM02DRAFT_3115448 [Thelephora ganbajun]|uniref:Uncharacterized protein n=1 Tax=Thelephora ganbajun TaxID=370292 RepID=A0ACB6ZFJ7_THEGA|nr:hypothetical protein BDM02DRAFT_3115448 [Thelephora ganbajun]
MENVMQNQSAHLVHSTRCPSIKTSSLVTGKRPSALTVFFSLPIRLIWFLMLPGQYQR